MSRSDAIDLVTRYYGAFNAGDLDAMVQLVSDDLRHDVNQGERRIGKQLFRAFGEHMSRCYRETLTDIVVFADDGGTRAAAEFVVNGEYLTTDEGLPPANGQTYRLPAGAFFDIAGGLITRVTTYYNLEDWKTQVLGTAA